MNKSFLKKVVVISGGASGIGEALVTRFAHQGAIVVIVDRNQELGVALAKKLSKKKHSVSFEHADMARIEEAESVFKRIIKVHGHMDYVINDAGVFMGGEIRDTDIEKWHLVVSNNVFAVMNGTHYAYQQMLMQGYGHIINLGSAAGLTPIPAMGIYGSTKYAIVGLSHALRNEAKSLGINVSVVCPTIVNTPLYDTAILNRVNRKRALRSRNIFQTPDQAAQKIIRGIAKNRATIHTAVSTRIMWLLYRLSPGIYNLLSRRILTKYRQQLRLKTK
jgi:short-subunit dehydrogenase